MLIILSPPQAKSLHGGVRCSRSAHLTQPCCDFFFSFSYSVGLTNFPVVFYLAFFITIEHSLLLELYIGIWVGKLSRARETLQLTLQSSEMNLTVQDMYTGYHKVSPMIEEIEMVRRWRIPSISL